MPIVVSKAADARVEVTGARFKAESSAGKKEREKERDAVIATYSLLASFTLLT